MNFVHDFLEPKTLKQVNTNGKRYYLGPDNQKYPSVTSCLSYFSKKGIAQWRKRVGEEEANRVSQKALRIGTAVHKVVEDYLHNNLVESEVNPVIYSRFNSIKSILDKNLDTIYGIELPLYSTELKVAGTTDLVAQFNSFNTVLDVKTANRTKYESQIFSYFLQCGTYAVCVEEHYDMNIDKIAILISVEDDEPQLFFKDANEYKDLARKFFKHYHSGKLF